MAARPRDRIWIEGERGRFDRFQRIEVSTDLFGEAQAVVQIADDRAWRTLRTDFYPGKEYRVVCNGLPVLVGRVDCHELPVTAEEGTTIQVVIRTRLADARVGTADAKVRVENASIKRFLLDLFAKHGFVESDFVFQPEADRDLVTGRKAGKPPPVDLEPLQADKAKVQPTETTEQAAKRHLERHHLMLWDAGAGGICVGIPDDRQAPLYRFEQRRGVCNFREARPVRDWGDVPSSIRVHGGALGGADITRAPFIGIASDPELATVGRGVHFRRPVVIKAEGVKDLARAQAQARRELAARSRRKAAWEIRADDWTFWDGSRAIPYAIGTTADINVEMHEGTDLRGVFLVTGCRKTLDPESGPSTTLTLLAQGLINPTG
jgi:hypothetical protein